MQSMYPKLQSADAIVLASHIFMGGVTGRMRAFMERTWHLRKGQLAGKIGTWIVVGRRKPGAAIYAMEDFLDLLGLTRLPGAFGCALHKGEILGDEETLRDVDRLAGDLLAQWHSPRPGTTGRWWACPALAGITGHLNQYVCGQEAASLQNSGSGSGAGTVLLRRSA